MTMSQSSPENEINQQLIAAAKQNDTPTVSRLLKKPDVDAFTTDDAGNSVSVYLAYFNNERVLNRLAQQWPEALHQKDESGYTPALWLAWNGNGNAVHALSQIDADVLTARDEGGKTPLMHLAMNDNELYNEGGSSYGFQLLLGLWISRVSCSASELDVLRPGLLKHVDNFGNTVPLLLAQLGEADIFQRMAVSYPEVLTHTDDAGTNVLMHLARRKKYLAVNSLAPMCSPEVLAQETAHGVSVNSWLAQFDHAAEYHRLRETFLP